MDDTHLIRTSPKFPVKDPSTYSSVLANWRFMYESTDTKYPMFTFNRPKPLQALEEHLSHDPQDITVFRGEKPIVSFHSMSFSTVIMVMTTYSNRIHLQWTHM
jgi:hypothetical protein